MLGTHSLGVINWAQDALEPITEPQLGSGHLQLCKTKPECLKVAGDIYISILKYPEFVLRKVGWANISRLVHLVDI